MEVNIDGHSVTIKLQPNKRYLAHCHCCPYFEQYGSEYDAIAFTKLHVEEQNLLKYILYGS